MYAWVVFRQWWNNLVLWSTKVIPHCSAASCTPLSLTDPPGAAMYFTPERAARKTLSTKGNCKPMVLRLAPIKARLIQQELTNASLDMATFPNFPIHSRFSSTLNSVGISSNTASYISFSKPASCGTCPETNKSIALHLSGLLTPFLNLNPRTRGCCLSHQLSALSPASRVQWIRDCWPAPRPMICPDFE